MNIKVKHGNKNKPNFKKVVLLFSIVIITLVLTIFLAVNIYVEENSDKELAKKEWAYSIKVDDKSIENNDVLEVNKSNFDIVYSETQNTSTDLPPDIHEDRSISGEFFDHVKFLDIKPNNTYITDGTVVQGMVYEFKNVPKGKVVKLQISNELMETLKLKTNIINIKVN